MTLSLLKRLTYAAQHGLRVTQFLGQSIASSIALRRRPSAEMQKALPPISLVLKDLVHLLERDLKNVEAGVYKMPKQDLIAPIAFAKTSTKFFFDLLKVYRRQQKKAVKDFEQGPVQAAQIASLPNYFKQTFHFQTDGYLSDSSADLYDHQVELVFAGGAEAMRRQALPPIFNEINRLKAQNPNSPFEMIDIACGTGRFLAELASNYGDNLRLTGLDLSPWYLRKARKVIGSQNVLRMNFIEANAEAIPFKDNHFDMVSCVFLFHELPRVARTKVISELARVLKPGGLLVFVDSIQLGDRPEFDGSLKFFPVAYHEPYYADYIEHDLPELFTKAGFQIESSSLAFFSKIITARKPLKS
jgi:ubiquinone/menaquinone biosynthesis C-methylase UbiE